MRTIFDFKFWISDCGRAKAPEFSRNNAAIPARSSAFRQLRVEQSSAYEFADAALAKAGTPCNKSKIQNKKSKIFPFLLSLLLAPTVFAQWQTQTITLKPGWNAVYLHVDASHVILDEDLPNEIEEIWRWQPSMAPDRFINDPQQPVSGNDWKSWNRSLSVPDTLALLFGNAAYLVRINGTIDYQWSLKGKPVPPRYEWTSKGVNFIGFSTPQSSPPLFANFLGPVPRLASEGEFFRYDDGNNDLTPSPFKAFFNTTPVKRGQAYWIRHANQFNRYFGAFEVTLQNNSGIHFRDFLDQHTIRLRNQTPTAITITLNLLTSETAPVGQTAVAALPPLIRRGELDIQNLSYGFTTFQSAQTVTLQPRGKVGSAVEIVLGINRLAMNGNAGDLFAGILRLTDSLGYTQIDLPVSAIQASGGASFASGLWVGNAVVNQVRHSLKNYQRDADNQPVLAQLDQQIAGTDTAGLLLEMHLDEGSGNIAKNSASGEAQILGTLFNSPSWLPVAASPPTDSERSALLFDSSQEQYVELSNGPVLRIPACTVFPAPATALSNVTEASQYGLVYSLNNLPNSADWDLHSQVTYTINNAAELSGTSFSRVAYYMELDNTWVWVSFDAITQDIAEIGIPADYVQQRTISNMNVFSNSGSVVAGEAITTGNIEFWPGGYTANAGLSGIPVGNPNLYDFNDSANPDKVYGSFQIHNYAEAQTIMAFNRWSGGGVLDLGIGNQPSGQSDWTFCRERSQLYNQEALRPDRVHTHNSESVHTGSLDLYDH